LRWGSKATKDWPGKAPARVRRKGLSRCSMVLSQSSDGDEQIYHFV
jgi:hypothetical protein